ncbi:MAG: GUN4 domain-containing protein [Verrucomicrobia bacterium]|nr:GUN4 domain-containing protein [Leptolyngbya sp. ES-bin-22]
MSEKGVDYTQLRDLLQGGKWQDADQETAARMFEVMGRQREGYLELKNILNFPCTDLGVEST